MLGGTGDLSETGPERNGGDIVLLKNLLVPDGALKVRLGQLNDSLKVWLGLLNDGLDSNLIPSLNDSNVASCKQAILIAWFTDLS